MYCTCTYLIASLSVVFFKKWPIFGELSNPFQNYYKPVIAFPSNIHVQYTCTCTCVLRMFLHVSVVVPTTTQEYESARESWEVREGELEQQLEDAKKEITSKANVPLKKVSAINFLYLIGN